MTNDSFGAKGTFEVRGKSLRIARIPALKQHGFRGGHPALCHASAPGEPLASRGWGFRGQGGHRSCGGMGSRVPCKVREIAFPARPGSDARFYWGAGGGGPGGHAGCHGGAWGGDPSQINPLQPAEMVIDHSVQVDAFGSPDALSINSQKEFERNRERYSFLKWGQGAFENFRVVPPETGIVHQVNLEFLARCVMQNEGGLSPIPTPWWAPTATPP